MTIKESPINEENVTLLSMYKGRTFSPHLYDKSSTVESPLDYPGIFALIFGIGALYLHAKLSIFLCFATAISSWITVKPNERDWKSIAAVWSFSIIGFIVNYFVNWDGKY